MEQIKYSLMLIFLPVIVCAAHPPFQDEFIHVAFFDRDVIEFYSGSLLGSREYSYGDQFGSGVGRKSPLLAGLMSVAIPGAGEVYAGQWWRGLVHLGIEITGWAFYFHYDGRGDSQTDLYKRYANQYWSVVDYAEWLNDYWIDTIGDNRPHRIYIDPDENKNPWERVHWNEIHAVETRIAQFSHRLEPYGTQQYYELIGKYPQYTRGWKDSIPLEDKETERVAYFHDITEMFSYYSSKRGYANTLYGRAHNAVLVVFLNHFISAFHAAYLAHRFNKTRFVVDIENRNDLYGHRFVPAIRLNIGL
jgi:hypothetical protein